MLVSVLIIRVVPLHLLVFSLIMIYTFLGYTRCAVKRIQVHVPVNFSISQFVPLASPLLLKKYTLT